MMIHQNSDDDDDSQTKYNLNQNSDDLPKSDESPPAIAG